MRNFGVVLLNSGRRLSLVVVFSLAVASASNAEIVIDKRNASHKDGVHFVLFCAKPQKAVGPEKSWVGHAWIAWGTAESLDALETGAVNPELLLDSFGFYPAEEESKGAAMFKPVKGEIRTDIISKGDYVRLVVAVGPDVLDRIKEAVDEKKSQSPEGIYLLTKTIA